VAGVDEVCIDDGARNCGVIVVLGWFYSSVTRRSVSEGCCVGIVCIDMGLRWEAAAVYLCDARRCYGYCSYWLAQRI
jgi:hypothetical protein